MVFNNTFDISDIVYILTFIIAASSAIFTLCKWNRSRRIKQADYIKSLIEFKNNEIILEVFNLFDYNKEWYNVKFHRSDLENKIDYTLTYFDFICYLNDRRIFDKYTFILFKYQVDCIVKNRQVQDYLFNLFHYAKNNGLATSYYYILKYAEQQKIIDSDFYKMTASINRERYHRYII